MSTNYRAVVIGCGKVGAVWGMDASRPQPASHAEALVRNPQIQLVGLVDMDADTLKKASEHYKVPGYADARQALQELKPDIAVISAPPSAHETLVLLTLELGVPAIVCEKPLSDSLDAAGRMVEAARKSGSKVIVNHQRRFAPLFADAKGRIAAGELGGIQQASAYYTNGLLNNGTHTIDALRFLLGDEVLWVAGTHNDNNKAAVGGPNIDGLLCFKKGTIVSLQSLDNDAYILHDFRLFGTKGLLEVKKYGFRFEWTDAKEVTLPGVRELDWDSTRVLKEEGMLLRYTAEHAVACLEGAVPQSSLEDGYRTMQVLKALSESAKEGGKRIIIE